VKLFGTSMFTSLTEGALLGTRGLVRARNRLADDPVGKGKPGAAGVGWGFAVRGGGMVPGKVYWGPRNVFRFLEMASLDAHAEAHPQSAPPQGTRF
jgi:hypothetical protein